MVFGQIKQAEGFRQFLLPRSGEDTGELALVFTTHNLLKLYRICMTSTPANTQAL